VTKLIEKKYYLSFRDEIRGDKIISLWKQKKKKFRKDYFIRKKRSIWKVFSRSRITRLYLLDKKLWYISKKSLAPNSVLYTNKNQNFLILKNQISSLI